MAIPETEAADGEGRALPTTAAADPAARTVMPTPTRPAEATVTASARIGTRQRVTGAEATEVTEATEARETGSAIAAVGAGETRTTGETVARSAI